jgi:ribosomal protein L14E/L6E/L27E
MTKQSLRMLAIGMIVSTITFSLFYYMSDVKNHVPQAPKIVNEEDVNLYLSNNDKMSISISKYESFIEIKAEYEELLANKKAEEEKITHEEQRNDNKKNQELLEKDINIQSGMSGIQVSKLLETENIVESGLDFLASLMGNDSHKNIKVGVYTLNNEMTYEEISTIITAKKQ